MQAVKCDHIDSAPVDFSLFQTAAFCSAASSMYILQYSNVGRRRTGEPLSLDRSYFHVLQSMPS